MAMLASRSGFALALLAASLLGGQTIHAQTAATTYWTPGWLGFGGNLDAGQGAETYSRVTGFSESSVGGLLATRYNFPNGWFVGSERGGTGFSMSGVNQVGAFGSLYSEGVQVGYNFNNAPVTFYAGFNTLKYNSGIASSLTPLESAFTAVPGGYSAHAGVEFKPTSNFSLSLGAGVVQRSGRIDTDTTSSSQFGASQYDLVRSRR
jgi:hypothetical protein